MLDQILPSILSGATKLIGGFLGKSSQDEANRIAQQNADRNIALQKEFAQNAIQWKVDDATKAGIHPVYALGGSTTSFSPVSVGVSGADPLASSLSDMGQDVSRAAAALRGPSARGDAVTKVATEQELKGNNLKLENMELQNQILRSKLVTMNQPATPPGVEFPVPENKKIEERPPLMAFGSRWMTNPNTSPMKAWEDQYGDEGPVSWFLPPFIAANDALYNIRKSKAVQGFGSALRQFPSYRWALENQRSMMEKLYGRR